MQILLKDLLKETIQASGETMRASDFRKTSQGYEFKLGFRKQFQMLKDLINSNGSEGAIAEKLNTFFHENTGHKEKSIAMLSMATNIGENLLFFAMKKNPTGPILRIIVDWQDYYNSRQPMSEAVGKESSLKVQVYCDIDGILVDINDGFKKIPDGEVLWDFIKDNFKTPPAVILSAGQNADIAQQKTAWIHNNIGPSVKVIIASSDEPRSDKIIQSTGRVTHVLIDAVGDNITKWNNQAAHRIGILHTSAASSINQLKAFLPGAQS